ncbi:protein Flattop isoform X1 [Ranitomeya imitator]|uniref:protein Flattop isoform X1 n=1 Tax=Ranitomeya imitator TaxID=111125 RepID=UPI0037E93E87
MAAAYSANQYDGAFSSTRLQNWSVPRPRQEAAAFQDGFTQFISNDRGHLLSGVPRAKLSPWGTFIGTWDMPTKIPPAKVSLTSRSADASRRLTDWIRRSDNLVSACNGLRPDVTGKVPLTEKKMKICSSRAGLIQKGTPQKGAQQPRASPNEGRGSHHEAPMSPGDD